MNEESEETPMGQEIETAPEAEVEATTTDAPSCDLDSNSEPSNEPSIEDLQAKLADAEKRVLLAQADLENFRRRNLRDTQDRLRYASLDLMSETLESVDNLYRAIESYESEPNGDGLVEGVKMVAQQITSALENHGCKKIESVGQPFDPNLHQALQMQPSDQYDQNVVMADLRAGFQLHERVIRPAQVFVSTGPEKE